jgi:hypothetical protein
MYRKTSTSNLRDFKEDSIKSRISLLSEQDFKEIDDNISEAVMNAKKKVLTNADPTITEIRTVYIEILKFISERNLIIYGGTALDVALKSIGKKGFYNEWDLSDIDFYSSSLVDIIDLSNYLYRKGYVGVQVKDVVHDETFALFVNGKLYCEFTYVPRKILSYVPFMTINYKFFGFNNKLNVVHPHFSFIDMLRMFTDMTACFRWEKQYSRLEMMNDGFPLVDYSSMGYENIHPSNNIEKLMGLIYKEFIDKKGIIEYLILTGVLSYNFFIDNAVKTLNDEPSRKDNQIKPLSVVIPFLDFVCQSIDGTHDTYIRIGNELLNFVKNKAPKQELVTYKEFHPFFQFTQRMFIIYYDEEPLIRIIDGSNKCFPTITLKSGKKVGCYQSSLLSLLIFRFKAYAEIQSENDYNVKLYKIYSWMSSQLIKMANEFRHHFKQTPLDEGLFQELVSTCDGHFTTPERMAGAKRNKRVQAGKKAFVIDHKPAEFFARSEEKQENFQPENHLFRNSAGTIINNDTQKLIGNVKRRGNDSDEE